MIASIAAASIFAAAVLGAGPGIDCKVDGARTSAFVPNRLIVRPGPELADNLDLLRSTLRGLLQTDDLTIRPVGVRAFVVDSASTDISQLPIAALSRDVRFRYIMRDPYIFIHSAGGPTDPYYRSKVTPMWGLQAIHAAETWEKYSATGSAEVVVAVVDGGIDPTHEDLKPLWTGTKNVGKCGPKYVGYDAITNTCVVQTRGPHGTEMAGTIGAHANNGVGVVGVNWYVSLLSSAFMDQGIGCGSAAANALFFVNQAVAAGENIRVVNLSWGTFADVPEIREQLEFLSKAGVVLVASAGNAGENVDQTGKHMYPAGYKLDTLIAVAATRDDKSLLERSNRGAITVDIAAPGAHIPTTTIGPPFFYNTSTTGTSIAAAHVSGAIALLASKCPSAKGKQLKDFVLDNAQHVPGLHGLVADERFLDVASAMAKCAMVP
jgi:subtilisin family serine protease